LFDQRGCLSIVAVYREGTTAGAAALGRALAAALAERARAWPPGPADPAARGAVQQLRLEAAMRGVECSAGLPLAAGTVVVEPAPALRPGPGLRTVAVHPLPDLAALPEILAPWKGRLQGAALAGEPGWSLAASRSIESLASESTGALVGELGTLGISRFAAPGELQSPDAAWFNGGIDPLAALC
ncbi:MAG TPA: acyl-CoA reductase, partial [Thermoanaerobaculia bacterium]